MGVLPIGVGVGSTRKPKAAEAQESERLLQPPRSPVATHLTLTLSSPAPSRRILFRSCASAATACAYTAPTSETEKLEYWPLRNRMYSRQSKALPESRSRTLAHLAWSVGASSRCAEAVRYARRSSSLSGWWSKACERKIARSKRSRPNDSQACGRKMGNRNGQKTHIAGDCGTKRKNCSRRGKRARRAG